MPGVDPKNVQTLMRHSDRKMTLGVYVHSDKVRLSAAVAMLPNIQVPTSDNESHIKLA
jgi:integrase